jgi:UDPglucose--hexose-1-phosphate uridylyltransferase
MGLAVLPGRLASELEEIVQVLHGDRDLNPIAGDTAHPLNKHYAWLQDLLVAVPKGLSVEEITANVRDQVTDKFSEVLAACGVFKQDEKGELGWQRFLAHCGMQNY